MYILEYNSLINTLEHLEGFSQRDSQPREPNAPGKGVFGKLERHGISNEVPIAKVLLKILS